MTRASLALLACCLSVTLSACVTSGLDLDNIGRDPEPSAQPEPEATPDMEPDAAPDVGVDAAPDLDVVDMATDMAPDLDVVDMAPDMPPPDMTPDMDVDMGQCREGETRPCGETEEGACAFGVETCLDDGTYGPCEGAVGPADETCNATDDDCDGIVDEAVPPEPCGSDVGLCALGGRACVDGAFGECEGAVGPAPEVCDAADNDCDGETDETVLQTCDPAPEVCAPGTQTCEDGIFGECVQPLGPVNERCNGGDDDCDGEIDEDLERPCGQGCPVGVQRCEAGVWSLCDVPPPSDEICDGLDNDCDGNFDEALTRPCGVDQAPCVLGEEVCIAGEWANCDAAVVPQPEECNAIDDDCNGEIDDNVPPIPCGMEGGECQPGQRMCVDGAFGECDGNVDPLATDACNGADDDCDGIIDEDGSVDCGGNVGQCRPGLRPCRDGVVVDVCEGGVEPIAELCNGLDDDCDGSPDEGEGGRILACPLPGAIGECVAGNCAFETCRPGFIDVDRVDENGCERGCAELTAPVDFEPLAARPTLRLAGQGRAEALVFQQPDGDETDAILIVGEDRQTITPAGHDTLVVDVSPTVNAGWIVGMIDVTVARQTRVSWFIRDFDGDALFGNSIDIDQATQIALDQHAPSARFALAAVEGPDDASGRVNLIIQDQTEPDALPLDPVQLTGRGARVAVKPVVAATTDGFMIAWASVAPLGVLVAYVDTDGEVLRTFTIDTPGVPTALAVGRAGRDGRLAIRVGARTLIQTLTLDAPPEVLPAPADNSGLNAQNLDVVSVDQGFMITFTNAVGDIRGRLLEADGRYAAPTFSFLGDNEPARAVETMHTISDGLKVTTAWSIGALGQRMSLTCQ